MNDATLPRPCRVQGLRRETPDTFTLEMEAPGGSGGGSFQPGQFNMLYVFGVGEVPISISGDPSQPKRLKHTTREVGAVTRALLKLKKGQMLGVRGPFGNHWPVEKAQSRDVVIVAGGIGLAPLRPAIYHILARRKDYGRVVLLYGTRTPADILYRTELQQWRRRFDLELHVTVDRAVGRWRGNVGVAPALIHRAPLDAGNAVAMVCGPEIMMRFTIHELQKRGVDNGRIYVSMERNMKCGIGLCGHCQFGPEFVCKDGPVFPYSRIQSIFEKREI